MTEFPQAPGHFQKQMILKTQKITLFWTIQNKTAWG